jgi:hypothetical protein
VSSGDGDSASARYAVAEAASAGCIETFGVGFIDPVNPTR